MYDKIKLGNFLVVRKIESENKTGVYLVSNEKLGTELGLIKWNSAWRTYSFFPYGEMNFDAGCLEEIAAFLRKRKTDYVNAKTS